MDPLTQCLMAMLAEPGRTDELHEILGDFCHMVRNRLNSLKLGLYLVQRGGVIGSSGWPHVETRYRSIEQFVERFQSICRPMALRPMRITLGAVLEERRATWSAWMEKRGRALEWLPPAEEPDLVIDPGHLTAALDAWVLWRAEAGVPTTGARVSWQATATDLRWTWIEADAETGPADPAQPPNLALALLMRIAVEHGGRLVVETRAGGGLGVTLILPRPEPKPGEAGARRSAGSGFDPMLGARRASRR